MRSLISKYTSVALIVLLTGCGVDGTIRGRRLTQLPISLFTSFSLTSAQSDIATMTLESLGNAPGDYGFDETNPALRGRFRFDSTSKSLFFERSVASTNSWNDFTLFPPSLGAVAGYSFSEINKISVVIKAQQNANSGNSMCGLSLGFGTGTGNVNAALASTNLRLLGRNWLSATNGNKDARDFIRFGYNFGADEKFVIDSPINSYNRAGAWDGFTTAEWRESAGEFNLISGVDNAGDYLTYRMDITFDKVAHTVTALITPLASNVSMSGWAPSQSFVWDYSVSSTATTGGGLPRGGLDLTNVTGTSALSWDDFHAAKFSIGFVGNQYPRSCEFSGLQVTLE